MDERVEIGLSSVFPSCDEMPDTFKGVMPSSVASVIHHQVWMRDNLPPDHPVFSSNIFTRLIDKLGGRSLSQRRFEKTSRGYLRCENTNMEATDVPERLQLRDQIQELKTNLEDVKDDLTSKMEAVSGEVVEKLRENFEAQGVSSMTASELARLIQNKRVEGQANAQTRLLSLHLYLT